MDIEKFEAAFSDFIDGREYDTAEESLFILVRAAYAAGWRAAGGAPCGGPPPLEIIKKRIPC